MKKQKLREERQLLDKLERELEQKPIQKQMPIQKPKLLKQQAEQAKKATAEQAQKAKTAAKDERLEKACDAAEHACLAFALEDRTLL